MNWLLNELLGNIFNNIRLLVDWIASPFLDPAGFFRRIRGGTLALPTGVKRALVFLFVATVVITLGILTWALGLDRHAAGPWFFRKTWMGWIALLGYGILKVLIIVLRQIRLLPPLLKTWPDITRAMEAGQQAVADAGLRIDQTPIFVVVGLSARAEQAFVESEQIGQDVCVDDPALPVHWYGDGNALWITLPAVSCTAAQSELLEQFTEDESVEAVDEQRTAATLSGKLVLGKVARRRNRQDALITANQRSTARGRMAYFCQELRQIRAPVCTANGVLLMLPFNDAAVVETHSRGLNDCIRTDMTVLQENLGVRCLTLTVLTANSDNPAFRSYISRLSPESIRRRCGVGFPQLVYLQNDDGTRICDWLIRDFELQAMHLYKDHPGDPDNEAIFEFVDIFRQGHKCWSGMLTSAFGHDTSNHFYFGGLYLAELSTVKSAPMPFMNGVLAKMRREHDELIAWSDQAIVEDTRNRRASYLLFTVTALLLIMSAGMVWNLVEG